MKPKPGPIWKVKKPSLKERQVIALESIAAALDIIQTEGMPERYIEVTLQTNDLVDEVARLTRTVEQLLYRSKEFG